MISSIVRCDTSRTVAKDFVVYPLSKHVLVSQDPRTRSRGKAAAFWSSKLLQFTAGASNESSAEIFQTFANIDHITRTRRRGSLRGAGKPPYRIATILDNFARNLNDQIEESKEYFIRSSQRAILATRVTQEQAIWWSKGYQSQRWNTWSH